MKHARNHFLRRPCGRMIFFLLLIPLCLVAAFALSEDRFPTPTGAVNDFAEIIPAAEKSSMEALSREVLEKTGTALVLATIPTIGNREINEYVNRLYSAWGIGKKGEDKGVLIVLALKERKLRIETGYGVEGILPDGLVGEIRDQAMLPWLKKGDYGRGLSEGVTAIAGIIAKNADVTLTGNPAMHAQKQRQAKRGPSWLTWLLLIVVISALLGTRQGREMLPWILLMILSSSGRRGGGGFDGFGGGFEGFGGGSSGGGGAGGDY